MTVIAPRAVLNERRLFSRHGLLLLYVGRHPGQTASEISEGLGLNIGTVWSVIGNLRSEGLLRIDKQRRRNVYYADVPALSASSLRLFGTTPQPS
jgi:DNA-binding MarR family transcriptional regulator